MSQFCLHPLKRQHVKGERFWYSLSAILNFTMEFVVLSTLRFYPKMMGFSDAVQTLFSEIRP